MTAEVLAPPFDASAEISSKSRSAASRITASLAATAAGTSSSRSSVGALIIATVPRRLFAVPHAGGDELSTSSVLQLRGERTGLGRGEPGCTGKADFRRSARRGRRLCRGDSLHSAEPERRRDAASRLEQSCGRWGGWARGGGRNGRRGERRRRRRRESRAGVKMRTGVTQAMGPACPSWL